MELLKLKCANASLVVRASALTIILVALTIKFRVHCFLVLAPTVFGFLVLNAWWRRRWLLLAPLGLGAIVIGLQLAEMHLPSLAGGHAAHHIGSVGDHLFGMEGAFLAGESLDNYAGVLIH